jgi:hypothetical protein
MHRVESFMQLPFTQKRIYTMRVDRSHLGRDREITWPSQEILSARDETLCR